MLRPLEPKPILHRPLQASAVGIQIPPAAASDTLRVAVDPFAEAETRYKSLVTERRSGSLPPRAFRLAVRDIAVLDSEGRRWMLGPEDGIWYRRENERWLQADPPRRLVCAFRLAVRDIAVLDSEGRRWMLGPEDGIWYRRENERWLQADPPRRLVCA